MKQDINTLPISSLTRETTDDFLNRYNLGSNHQWIIPQALATFAREAPPIKVNDKYSPSATLAAVEGNKLIRGLWTLLMLPRSKLISDTPLYKVKEYGPLVPLFLSAYKIYHNIPYSSWSSDGLEYLVDAPLLEAMTYVSVHTLTAADFLAIREHGLLFRSGKHEGKFRNPATTAMLYSLNTFDSVINLSSIPKLWLVMKTQIWCAHPDNRHKNMILDPDNWDSMPEPLISTEVLEKNLDLPPWQL